MGVAVMNRDTLYARAKLLSMFDRNTLDSFADEAGIRNPSGFNRPELVAQLCHSWPHESIKERTQIRLDVAAGE